MGSLSPYAGHNGKYRVSVGDAENCRRRTTIGRKVPRHDAECPLNCSVGRRHLEKSKPGLSDPASGGASRAPPRRGKAGGQKTQKRNSSAIAASEKLAKS